MKQAFAALISGILFGIGLALSGMINPNKVLNFLDVFGNWDPSLAFVMGGGLFVTFIAFHFIPKLKKPIIEDKFRLPTSRDIDKPLIIGAALFGIGWGIAGYCPGPGFASLGLGLFDAVIWVVALLAGFVTHHFFDLIVNKNIS